MCLRTFVNLFIAIPAAVVLATLLMLRELEIEKAVRVNLITNEDYGYGVSGKRFLLALVTVAVLVGLFLLLLALGKGEV